MSYKHTIIYGIEILIIIFVKEEYIIITEIAEFKDILNKYYKDSVPPSISHVKSFKTLRYLQEHYYIQFTKFTLSIIFLLPYNNKSTKKYEICLLDNDLCYNYAYLGCNLPLGVKGTESKKLIMNLIIELINIDK